MIYFVLIHLLFIPPVIEGCNMTDHYDFMLKVWFSLNNHGRFTSEGQRSQRRNPLQERPFSSGLDLSRPISQIEIRFKIQTLIYGAMK